MESKPVLVSVVEVARMLSIGRTAAWELVRISSQFIVFGGSDGGKDG